jgi:hypothetical protein
LGVEFYGHRVTILLDGQELCVRVIVGQCGCQAVCETILLTYSGQGINKLENLGPGQEITGVGVIEMTTALSEMSLKAFYQVLHGILRMGTNAPRNRCFITVRGAEIILAFRKDASLPLSSSEPSGEPVVS